MRDSDTGWDLKVAVGISLLLGVATIGAGFLGNALSILLLGA